MGEGREDGEKEGRRGGKGGKGRKGLVLVGWAYLLMGFVMGWQPFNAFLSGFSATVGQFVLTASLRMQTNPANKGEFASVSHERYVVFLVSFVFFSAPLLSHYLWQRGLGGDVKGAVWLI